MSRGVSFAIVATVPTVYGIETLHFHASIQLLLQVATVPTVYGIETFLATISAWRFTSHVATVPTVYGMRRRVRDSRGTERR